MVISDSFGRPWRNGVTGVALGVARPARAGRTCVGAPDLFGRACASRESALADEIAAAASLADGRDRRGPSRRARTRRCDGRRRASRARARAGRATLGHVPMTPLTTTIPALRAAGLRAAGHRVDARALRRRRRREARRWASTPCSMRPADGRREHRRRLRASSGCASRPIVDTVRLHARGPERSRRVAGAAPTRPGTSWQAIAGLGGETWFSLGDRDLAMHVERTRRLRVRRDADARHRRHRATRLGIGARSAADDRRQRGARSFTRARVDAIVPALLRRGIAARRS